jgi:uncharacterized RDD family membrane protein YckC
MNCQNCDAPVLPSDERCERCGAKLLHRRAFPGAPKREDFILTADEPASDLEESPPDAGPEFPYSSEFSSAPHAAKPEIAPARYGGFWRRLFAFMIDLAVVALLCAVMGAMVYVGYKVGLAAHHRAVTLGNASPLMVFLTFSGVFLTTAYFVVFHGMAGQTIGKSVFRLRVVGPDQQPISYRRALLRWIGTFGFGAASLGVSVLWIVWSREKRAWHDYLARTWVIQD